MKLTDLSLVEATRSITGHDQQRRRFLDFAFDATPIYPLVLASGIDNITPIWLAGDDWCRTAVRRLLGEAEPDAPDGRVTVYVCAECGDLGCGAITVVIKRDNGAVGWRDWGYQNNYEEGFVAFDGPRMVTFDAAQYDAVLRKHSKGFAVSRSSGHLQVHFDSTETDSSQEPSLGSYFRQLKTLNPSKSAGSNVRAATWFRQSVLLPIDGVV